MYIIYEHNINVNFICTYMLSNKEIIDQIIKKSGCENSNQLAIYLTNKYGINVSRQSIQNFINAKQGTTITSLLLRESLENK